MKTRFALIGAFTLLAASAFGQGSQYIIKQRAKELVNQNNVRQGVAPPTQAAQPASAAAAAPVMSVGITRLHADLAALKSPITAEQKQKLSRDLISAAEGAGKPSGASANKLSEDIAAAFSEKPLSRESRARLIQELDAILNPAKYPQAKPDGIFTDAQAIFQENGLVRKQAVAIGDDIKAVAADVQKGR